MKLITIITALFLINTSIWAKSELTVKSDYNFVEKAVVHHHQKLDELITTHFGEEFNLVDNLKCLESENSQINGNTGICTINAWPLAGDSIDFLMVFRIDLYFNHFNENQIPNADFFFLDFVIVHED